ncbi:hypothetical protein RF11_03394 [Thelohanellus kitauei]|uniref:Calcineurin-like phosphoesterase domain-containing protein n=1 Tax=Thelohanellus kitauei TaxID=669202 RepID=A0A0C2IHJ0_THEKT|nr:hypothetical protein RF11_03394 [Thelohanellus kitauei]
MTVSKLMPIKSTMLCWFTVLIYTTIAQKKLSIDGLELNVVIIGNIGVTDDESDVKRDVVGIIKDMHNIHPYQLGINLGNSIRPHGSDVNDFQKLDDVFSSTFPSDIFGFDFLTILGENDHDGDFDTQIQYHYQKDERFYLPKRNYVYDVTLSDGTSIRFMCIDSTPIYETEMINFHHVFLIMHHNVVNGCGQHKAFPHDEHFMRLVTHDSLSAIITAHDYNMQMFDRYLNRPPVFTVGNSAHAGPIPVISANHICCISPESGGFGKLLIKKESASFSFISGNGHMLALVEIAKGKNHGSSK